MHEKLDYIKMDKIVIHIYFSRKRSVDFNIRREESVIQTSLKEGECNFLK